MKSTDLLKKLRFDTCQRALVLNAPMEYSNLFSGMCDTKRNSKIQYDFIQVFAATQKELESIVKQAAKAGRHDCVFWACYPKGTGKIKSDIKRDTVWRALKLAGLRPVSQIAIDETWSAMRGRPPEAVGK
jgi:hypothetical protein